MTDKAAMAANEEQGSVFADLMRFKPDGMTLNGWAVVAGLSRTVWADMRRHDNPSRRTLEKLLGAAGSSLAEFEALRIGPSTAATARAGNAGVAEPIRAAWRQSTAPAIPVFHTAAPREWGGYAGVVTEIDRGRPIGAVDRIASLTGDGGAYALTIVRDSMWPRFRPGRCILISPQATIAIGDDVVVLLLLAREGNGPAGALIMELVARDAGVVQLRQFNPPRSITVSTSEIASMHKIVGEHF